VYLVQVLLPLYDNEGQRLPQEAFGKVRDELTARFGGLTAYTRSPAEGLWKADAEKLTRDDIVLFEIMAPVLDRAWWRTYRRELERRFRQEVVIIRAQAMEQL
jgi:hypothetical protein